jgi:predicted DNA-binding antitoxin AbrB/MazE fold protein
MITMEATYEGGVLKPAQPLPLDEHEKVQITVRALTAPDQNTDADAERLVRRSHGLLGWTGDAQTLRRLAEDPDFDPQENA